MFDIITIGDATFDTFLVIDDDSPQCQLNRDKTLLCLNYADKISLKQLDQSTGGNAANVAVGLRKLGLKTAIVTELGDDINGWAIENQLEKAGVNTGLIKTRVGKETRFSIVLNYKSERTILSYHAPRRYTLPHLPEASWIYYTSLGKTFEQLQKKLIDLKNKRPTMRIAANPGSYQLRHGIDTFKKILPHTEVLFVNKEECCCLVGKKASLPASFAALHRLGPKVVVLTDGTKGSYASDGKTILFLPPFPIEAVAKTGAGDAYASGFLAAHIQGKPLAEAMRWGTANAGGVIQKIGAQQGLLTRSGLNTLVTKYSKIVAKTAN